MNRVGRILSQGKKWILFILKGVAILPSYIRYWGVFLAIRRSAKSLILPGLNQMAIEMANFLELKQSLVKVTRTPDYIVVAPDFISNSAGICCLYQLCGDLRKMGFETAITGSQRGNPNFPVPLIPNSEATEAAKNGAWVIYPEVIMGNPLKAKNVIRWCLNRPGLLGGEEVYPSSEHVFTYSDVFAPYIKNEIRGKLYMPTIDRSLFYPPKSAQQPRSLECYYVGKSRYKDGIVDTKQALEITRFTPPKSELGKIFRSAKVLYSFDNSTALIYEALLCGCPVVIIPDGTQTWSDYEKLELGTAGITWGLPDGSIPSFDAQDLHERLSRWESQYQEQLQFLVSYTQDISPSSFFDFRKTKSQRSPEQVQQRAVELPT